MFLMLYPYCINDFYIYVWVTRKQISKSAKLVLVPQKSCFVAQKPTQLKQLSPGKEQNNAPVFPVASKLYMANWEICVSFWDWGSECFIHGRNFEHVKTGMLAFCQNHRSISWGALDSAHMMDHMRFEVVKACQGQGLESVPFLSGNVHQKAFGHPYMSPKINGNNAIYSARLHQPSNFRRFPQRLH